jgi:hypothetical protein
MLAAGVTSTASIAIAAAARAPMTLCLSRTEIAELTRA